MSGGAIKAAAALRHRGEREAEGRTLVDGVRELQRAFESGATIDEVFVCEPLLAERGASGLIDALGKAGVPVTEVAQRAMERLSFGDRAEGIVGVVRIPALGLDRLSLGPDPLVVVLEGVEKPGNLGAVLRTADGVGVDACIVVEPRTDPFNPNVVRASLGTVFAVPLAVATSPETLAWLVGGGIRPVTARVDAEIPYTFVDYRGPSALVLGAETTGLTETWSGRDVVAVSLPMHGIADSLNVSATAAVLLYEARRQRDLPPAQGW